MTLQHPPCFFGEILIDVFPDGREVLGGAPFNVAWHLQGFGLNPLLISRVGADAAGERIRGAMAAWGMRLDGLQSDPVHPTGRVTVSLRDGEPSFDIVTDSAWDFIAADELPDLIPAIVYHGSLALRNPVSAAALYALLARHGVGPAARLPAAAVTRATADRRTGAAARPLRFVDVNLRPPWWHAEEVRRLLDGADWVKLNQQELAWLTPAPTMDPDPVFSTAGQGEATGVGEAERVVIARGAEALRARHGLAGLVLTRGGAGAVGLLASGETAQVSPKPAPLVDAVGAGDAFAAVTLLGLLRDWPLPLTLDRAQTFASRIVQLRGATAPDRALYQDLRRAWMLDSGHQS
ncbi:MAG: PfkB family carbohydrate kinase [Chromatiaceae bacterium]|nr:PfkB family carbohydrate kinase [Candidatus Thioaporhodococcus sediminis]